MKILTEQGYIDAVGLFFELTDEQLEHVKCHKHYYMDEELVKKYNASKGDNAHFVGVMNNNGNNSLLNKHLHLLLKDYKSVSWWNRDMTEFHIKRR